MPERTHRTCFHTGICFLDVPPQTCSPKARKTKTNANKSRMACKVFIIDTIKDFSVLADCNNTVNTDLWYRLLFVTLRYCDCIAVPAENILIRYVHSTTKKPLHTKASSSSSSSLYLFNEIQQIPYVQWVKAHWTTHTGLIQALTVALLVHRDQPRG